MAEADPEFERLLAQRSFAAFRQLCDFGDRDLRFRMRTQLFDVCLGILTTHHFFLVFLAITGGSFCNSPSPLPSPAITAQQFVARYQFLDL